MYQFPVHYVIQYRNTQFPDEEEEQQQPQPQQQQQQHQHYVDNNK